MEYKILLREIKKLIADYYGDKKFYLDSKCLEDILVNTYQQDLNNMTLPSQAIFQVITTSEISLNEYAIQNDISYSAIVSNKNRYASIRQIGSRYVICKYELLHSKRIENDFGSKVEWLIRNNSSLADKLLELALERNKGIGETLVDLLREYKN